MVQLQACGGRQQLACHHQHAATAAALPAGLPTATLQPTHQLVGGPVQVQAQLVAVQVARHVPELQAGTKGPQLQAGRRGRDEPKGWALSSRPHTACHNTRGSCHSWAGSAAQNAAQRAAPARGSRPRGCAAPCRP